MEIILDGLESAHLTPQEVLEASIEAFRAEKLVLLVVDLPEPEPAAETEKEEPQEEAGV
ncbi:unnamed protein product [Effrenium voratum]|uniref:Uncharacterized protein n=1 Tax=Effrenium voratum TaxID=2562239 RepID=A0AA36J4H7_9DINO|nr:unnamed protein product [Effrenium voratum]